MNAADFLRKNRFLQAGIYAKQSKIKIDRVYNQLSYGYEALRFRYYNGVFTTDHYDPELVVETMHSYKRGAYIPYHDYKSWCAKNKGEDWHIGMFAHDLSWVADIKKNNTVGGAGKYVTTPVLWLDIDRPGPVDHALRESLDDAEKICNNLPRGSYSIMQSGNKGVHIAISSRLFAYPCGTTVQMCGRGRLFYNLAHRIAGDVRHRNGLFDPHMANNETIIEKYLELDLPDTDIAKMRQALETIDPNLYSSNSTIRAPHSIHEKTGNRKIRVSGAEFLDVLEYTGRASLIHLLDDCYEVVKKPNRYAKIKVDFNKVDQLYSEIFGDDWDPSSGGWLGPFFNPFYEDSKPSVNINTETGFFLDFGAVADYQIPFWKVWSLWYGVSEEQAKEDTK